MLQESGSARSAQREIIQEQRWPRPTLWKRRGEQSGSKSRGVRCLGSPRRCFGGGPLLRVCTGQEDGRGNPWMWPDSTLANTVPGDRWGHSPGTWEAEPAGGCRRMIAGGAAPLCPPPASWFSCCPSQCTPLGSHPKPRVSQGLRGLGRGSRRERLSSQLCTPGLKARRSGQTGGSGCPDPFAWQTRA